jgi:hypothetical protein
MPPIVISPLIRLALGVVGAGAAMFWAAREMRRLNEEIERVNAATTLDPAARRKLPTLRRDPRTDEWRVGAATRP